VSKLTGLLCTAVREGALKAHETPDCLNELLHYVRVANCNSSNERFEIERAVTNSDEWRSMLEQLVEFENLEQSSPPPADSDHNANPTRKRIDEFIRKLHNSTGASLLVLPIHLHHVAIFLQAIPQLS
jgi:hypothetical protein